MVWRVFCIDTQELCDIEIKGTSGEQDTKCPICSHKRKKHWLKCMRYNMDKEVGNCHHCGVRFCKVKDFDKPAKPFTVKSQLNTVKAIIQPNEEFDPIWSVQTKSISDYNNFNFNTMSTKTIRGVEYNLDVNWHTHNEYFGDYNNPDIFEWTEQDTADAGGRKFTYKGQELDINKLQLNNVHEYAKTDQKLSQRVFSELRQVKWDKPIYGEEMRSVHAVWIDDMTFLCAIHGDSVDRVNWIVPIHYLDDLVKCMDEEPAMFLYAQGWSGEYYKYEIPIQAIFHRARPILVGSTNMPCMMFTVKYPETIVSCPDMENYYTKDLTANAEEDDNKE